MGQDIHLIVEARTGRRWFEVSGSGKGAAEARDYPLFGRLIDGWVDRGWPDDSPRPAPYLQGANLHLWATIAELREADLGETVSFGRWLAGEEVGALVHFYGAANVRVLIHPES